MPLQPLTNPIDYILLEQKRSPGIAEIVGAGSPREWDIREGFGLSGAWCVYKGRSLARFSVRLTLTTAEDWTAWHAWKPTVLKYPRKRFGNGKDSGAMDIWHPVLEDLEIRAVVVEDVLPASGDTGEWTFEIKLLEFRRPKVTLAKPEGASATPSDPIEDLYIKPLMDQVSRLANE